MLKRPSSGSFVNWKILIPVFFLKHQFQVARHSHYPGNHMDMLRCLLHGFATPAIALYRAMVHEAGQPACPTLRNRAPGTPQSGTRSCGPAGRGIPSAINLRLPVCHRWHYETGGSPARLIQTPRDTQGGKAISLIVAFFEVFGCINYRKYDRPAF